MERCEKQDGLNISALSFSQDQWECFMCVCKFIASARRRDKKVPQKRWLWSKSKSAWEERTDEKEEKADLKARQHIF